MNGSLIPIITIDHKYNIDDLQFVISLGVDCFRLNPARIGIENATKVHSLVCSIADSSSFFFDTAGNKHRIHYTPPTNGRYLKVCIHGDDKNDISFFVSFILLCDVAIGDIIVLRGDEKIEFSIENKSDTGVIARPLMSYVNRIKDKMHVYIKNKYNPNTALTKADIDIITSFRGYGTVCISFADNAQIIREAKKISGKAKILAKIESPEGIRNADEIFREADGVIVGRDDLSAFYTPETIRDITMNLLAFGDRYGKIVIPASNYFLFLIAEKPIGEVWNDLYSVLYSNAHFIYINETVMTRKHECISKIINLCTKGAISHIGI